MLTYPLSVLRLPLPAAVLLPDSSEHRPAPWGEMVSRLSSSGKNTDDFREKAEQYAAIFESARSIFLDLMDEDAKKLL